MSKFHAAMKRVEELEGVRPPVPSLGSPARGATETGLLRAIPAPAVGADDVEVASIDTIVSVVAGGESASGVEARTDASTADPGPSSLGISRLSPTEGAPLPVLEVEEFWRRVRKASTPVPAAEESSLPTPAEAGRALTPAAKPGDRPLGKRPVSVHIGGGKPPKGAALTRVELVAPDLDSFVAEYGPCVSKGGMFVAADSPLRSGTPVEVYVRLESGDTLLRGAGAVEWSRSEAPGMGIRFLDLDENSLALIEGIVSRHVEGGGVPFDLHRGGPERQRRPSAASSHEVEQGIEDSDAGSSQAGSPLQSPPAEANRGGDERPRRRVAKAERTAPGLRPARNEYERIVQRLLAARSRSGHAVILIVSATPRGGASTLARKLATALASDGSERVVLVDANLRAPTQHVASRTLESYGLADVLRGDVPLGAALKHERRPAYWLLTSGRTPESPAYLFSQSPLENVLTKLREEFDWVIIDGPPVNTCPEAAILAKASDAALLVLEAERTRWEVAEEAKVVLEASGVDLLGTVLNRRKEYLPGSLFRHL